MFCLQEARAKFRQVLTESTQMLNIQAKKLGACIEKARPYYEARIQAKQVICVTNEVSSLLAPVVTGSK